MNNLKHIGGEIESKQKDQSKKQISSNNSDVHSVDEEIKQLATPNSQVVQLEDGNLINLQEARAHSALESPINKQNKLEVSPLPFQNSKDKTQTPVGATIQNNKPTLTQSSSLIKLGHPNQSNLTGQQVVTLQQQQQPQQKQKQQKPRPLSANKHPGAANKNYRRTFVTVAQQNSEQEMQPNMQKQKLTLDSGEEDDDEPGEMVDYAHYDQEIESLQESNLDEQQIEDKIIQEEQVLFNNTQGFDEDKQTPFLDRRPSDLSNGIQIEYDNYNNNRNNLNNLQQVIQHSACQTELGRSEPHIVMVQAKLMESQDLDRQYFQEEDTHSAVHEEQTCLYEQDQSPVQIQEINTNHPYVHDELQQQEEQLMMSPWENPTYYKQIELAGVDEEAINPLEYQTEQTNEDQTHSNHDSQEMQQHYPTAQQVVRNQNQIKAIEIQQNVHNLYQQQSDPLQSKKDVVQALVEKIHLFDQHERHLIQSRYAYNNDKQRTSKMNVKRFIYDPEEKILNQIKQEKQTNLQKTDFTIQIEAQTTKTRETIQKDLLEQEKLHEILDLYGNDSQWRNYESKIKKLNFMTNYSRVKENKELPVSERILDEARRKASLQSQYINNTIQQLNNQTILSGQNGASSPMYGTRQSTNSPDKRSQWQNEKTTLNEPSILSTLDHMDGPSIHVSHRNQLKKEMIDPSLCASLIPQNKTEQPDPEKFNVETNPHLVTREGRRILSQAGHHTQKISIDLEQRRRDQDKKSKKEWHEFIHYIAENPNTMMCLVASPKHVAIDLKKFGGTINSNQKSPIKENKKQYQQAANTTQLQTGTTTLKDSRVLSSQKLFKPVRSGNANNCSNSNSRTQMNQSTNLGSSRTGGRILSMAHPQAASIVGGTNMTKIDSNTNINTMMLGMSREKANFSQRPRSGQQQKAFGGAVGQRTMRPRTAKQQVAAKISQNLSRCSLQQDSDVRIAGNLSRPFSGASEVRDYQGNVNRSNNNPYQRQQPLGDSRTTRHQNPILMQSNTDEPEIINQMQLKNVQLNQYIDQKHLASVEGTTVFTIDESQDGQASQASKAHAVEVLCRMNGTDQQQRYNLNEIRSLNEQANSQITTHTRSKPLQTITSSYADQNEPRNYTKPLKRTASAHTATHPQRISTSGKQQTLTKQRNALLSNEQVNSRPQTAIVPNPLNTVQTFHTQISFTGMNDTAQSQKQISYKTYKHKHQSIKIDGTSIASRKQLWEDQLCVKKLQDQQNFAMTNFAHTNMQLRDKLRKRELQRKQEELNNYNLSNDLLSKLGLKKRIKYVKSKEDSNVVPLNDLPLIDWKKTLLRKNIDKSWLFNYQNDPRCFTVDQIPYCINLLRYCVKDFPNSGDKLRQMFKMTFDTLEAIYEEMGMKRLFQELIADLEDVTQQVCLRLLVRCQFMLKVRERLVEVFKLIDKREMLLKNCNLAVLQAEQLEESFIREKVQLLTDITNDCLKMITDLQKDKPHLIGKTFLYAGMDFSVISKVEILQICDLLAKFGIQVTPEGLVTEGTVHNTIDYGHTTQESHEKTANKEKNNYSDNNRSDSNVDAAGVNQNLGYVVNGRDLATNDVRMASFQEEGSIFDKRISALESGRDF